MSKKCLYTLPFFCVFTALASVFMRLFLLFPFNEWVGLGTGLALFLAAGALWIAVKKNRAVPYIVCAVNAAASGIGLSSFYVWLGSIPAVWQIAAVWGAYSVFFSCFCCLRMCVLCVIIPRRAPLHFCCFRLQAASSGCAFRRSRYFRSRCF